MKLNLKGMGKGGLAVVLSVIVLCLSFSLPFAESSKLPPAPRKLRVRAISPHVIKLRWRDPGKNKGRATRFYSVRYSALGAKDSQFLQSGDSRVRVGKLHPNTTYVFSVKTIAGKRGSPWSESVRVTTAVVEHRVVTKLKAVPLSSDSIQLTWKLPKRTSETVAYAILWAEHEVDDSERTAVVANGSTSFTQDNLRPYRLYSFRVRSMLSEGPGGSTEKVLARPYSDKPSKAPRSVALKYSNDSYVLVSWRPPALRQRNGVLSGYKLQYKRKGSRRGDVCSVFIEPKDTRYILTDIEGGQTYKIRVSASTVNGTGPYSKWMSVNIPFYNNTESVDRKYKRKPGEGVHDDQTTDDSETITTAPEKLFADDVMSTAVTISWSQPATPVCCPIVAYRIVSRNLNTSEQSGEIVTGPRPLAKISFLQPDTLYGFNVSAYSIAGESEQSDELIIHTLPAEPPAILSVHGSSIVAGSSVNLSCVVRAEPPPEVSWFGPNKTLPYSTGRVTNLLLHREDGVHILHLHKSPHDVTSHLIIDNVTPEQSGTYTCVASNSAGTVRKLVTLQVHVSPLILESEGTTVMDGKDGKLMCVVQGTPLPTVVWLREQTDVVFEEEKEESRVSPSSSPYVTSVIEGDGSVRRSFLHFPQTTLDHHGNYTCLARSLAGTNETKVLLTVNIPPPPPVQSLRAIALSPHSVSVVWDRPFEYNYTIDGYRVSIRQLEGGHTKYFETQGPKQEIQGLSPRHQYIISVIPYNAQSLGDTDSEVMVTTLSNEGLQPANVSAVALNSSMIQLDWASPQNIDRLYIRGYNIYYRRENDTQQEMLFIEGNRNKQFLIGLGRDETYYLRIATLTTWGYEAPSQWIRIQKHPHELLPPVTPKQAKAVTTMDSIRVSWASSNEPGSKKSPLLGYRMIYGPADAPSEINRINLGSTATQFTIRGLSSSKKYIIALRAFNKYAVSEPMYLRAVTKAMPPSTVLKATAVPLSPTEIHVHWRPPQRGKVSRYQLRYWRPGKRDKQSAWLETPITNYVAGSLKPHSQYRFEIIPFSGDVIGEGSVIFADTLSTKPAAPPAAVVMTAVNATHILVTWKPPPPGQQNGVINGYKLIMKKKGGPRLAKFSVDGARYNYTFTNLEPASTYKIRMAAMNSNGTGPFTEWIVGHTDKLEMRQPDSPQSMELKAESRSLEVTWSAPHDMGVPVMGYIVGYGRYIPEVYRVILGPRERHHVITDLKPDTEYIVSVRAFNHIGESVPQFTVAQTLTAPPEIRLEVPIKLKVVPLSPTSMALSWLDPSLLKRPTSSMSSSTSTLSSSQPSDGRVYLIRYSAISGENYQYVNATTTFLNVTGLEVATPYEFAVRTTRDGVQSGWSLPVVNTTQHMAPSTPPRKVTVVASPSASTLNLNWTQPALPNGHIIEYIVYYTAEPSIDTKLWMIKTTKKRSTSIGNVMLHTSYYFRVQARNTAGYGPLSETVVYHPPSDSRAAPSNVTVWSLYGDISTAVEVVWQKPSSPMGHITGYMVYYTPDDDQSDSNWIIQRERGLSALILGLTHNSTYHFKVRARYGASLGPFSDTVTFNTPEEEWDESDDATTVTYTTLHTEESFNNMSISDKSVTKVPQPPHGLSVEVGSDHANLTWDPPANISQSVNADHDTSPNNTLPEGSPLNVNVTGVQPTNSQGESSNSIQHFSYELKLFQGTEASKLVMMKILTDTNYSFTQLEDDTRYMATVKAISRNSISSEAAVLMFHTLPAHVAPSVNTHSHPSSSESTQSHPSRSPSPKSHPLQPPVADPSPTLPVAPAT